MKFAIFTLGCKVNTYESNVMSDLLKKRGYIEVPNEELADIYIINTCSVTNTADHKSLKTVRHAINKNKKAIIIVVGCLVQVQSDLLKDLPIHIMIGNKYKSQIDKLLDTYLITKQPIIKLASLAKTEFENMCISHFNKTRAFVKIQDGCNNFCSYCIIPYTRGGIRSKNKDDVIDEIRQLVSNNHKEIVLTGIHTGNYGAEFKDYNFANLLQDIIKIEGLKRLRISSIEMNEITPSVLEVFKNSKLLVNHMHIPLQSGSDKILKDMNRKYTKQEFIEKIEALRQIRPHISITTDVIVGFPTETDEDFEETIKTIKQLEFAKIHVFPFSKRDKTKAATLKNSVTTAKKKARVQALLNLSRQLEETYMHKFVGEEVTIIPEIYKDNYLIGHSANYLMVKVAGTKDELNQEIKVTISSCAYPYLIGQR